MGTGGSKVMFQANHRFIYSAGDSWPGSCRWLERITESDNYSQAFGRLPLHIMDFVRKKCKTASKHSEGTAEEGHSMLASQTDGTTNESSKDDQQNNLEYNVTHSGNRLDGLEDLLQHTKFTRLELQRMYRGFKNECTNGLVDRETFKKIYAQFFPYGDSSQYANLLFNVFDQNKNGRISFEDFVLGLSISLHGTLDEKMKWAFQLYDLDGDGVITREELATVVHSVHCMMGEALASGEECSVQEQVERLFVLMDTNEDGVITEDEFIEGCKKDESIKQSLAVFSSNR